MKKKFCLWLLPILWTLITFFLYEAGENPLKFGALPSTFILLLPNKWIGLHPVRAIFVAGFIMMASAGILLDKLRIIKLIG